MAVVMSFIATVLAAILETPPPRGFKTRDIYIPRRHIDHQGTWSELSLKLNDSIRSKYSHSTRRLVWILSISLRGDPLGRDISIEIWLWRIFAQADVTLHRSIAPATGRAWFVYTYAVDELQAGDLTFVCPLAQGEVIAFLTAAMSLSTPLAKAATGLNFAACSMSPTSSLSSSGPSTGGRRWQYGRQPVRAHSLQSLLPKWLLILRDRRARWSSTGR